MSDFRQTHGSVNSGVSDERPNMEGGVPKTGFSEAPKGERGDHGPGPATGGNRTRIR